MIFFTVLVFTFDLITPLTGIVATPAWHFRASAADWIPAPRAGLSFALPSGTELSDTSAHAILFDAANPFAALDFRFQNCTAFSLYIHGQNLG